MFAGLYAMIGFMVIASLVCRFVGDPCITFGVGK